MEVRALENPVIAALKDAQPTTFHPIVEADVEEQMVEPRGVLAHECQHRLRVRKALEEIAELGDEIGRASCRERVCLVV